MGCCNCIDKQFTFLNRNKIRKEQEKECIEKDEQNCNNTSFELKKDEKISRIKPSKNTNLSYQDTNGISRDMSTTIGNQRSESTSKDFIQSNTSNEAQINDCKTSISNLKKTSINNKLIVKKNEKLSSFVNLDIRKKKSSNLLNTSKLVITEKDSKKEDSERTDKNHSGRKKNNKNTSNLVFEGIMNSNESNFSGLKNSTLGSRLSHIFSDHSLNFEKSGMPMNILKTNKSPKLLDKYKEISSNNMNYNKILSQTSISMLLNNSRDTFHKYKHLFGDVDSPSKFLRVSSNSLQFKKNREQNAEEGDLSTIRNKSSNRTKGFNNIFTFRKEVELAKVHPNNDIMRIKNDVININDLNLKKFRSNGNK